jgi:hypothetical protein
MNHLVFKHQRHMWHKGFFKASPLQHIKRKGRCFNNIPFDYRHAVGRTYPWQVAPQQSLLPFRFNFAKFKSENYIYNLSKFSATFT